MAIVIVQGVFTVDPEERDRFVEASIDGMRSSRQEEGCLEYVMAADPLDPERVVLSERWESMDHLSSTLPNSGRRTGTRPDRHREMSRSRFSRLPRRARWSDDQRRSNDPSEHAAAKRIPAKPVALSAMPAIRWSTYVRHSAPVWIGSRSDTPWRCPCELDQLVAAGDRQLGSPADVQPDNRMTDLLDDGVSVPFRLGVTAEFCDGELQMQLRPRAEVLRHGGSGPASWR